MSVKTIPISYSAGKTDARGRKNYAGYLKVRPRIAEIKSGRRIIKYFQETSCRKLIVHTSIPETVYQARKVRLKGVQVYIGTCPQRAQMKNFSLISNVDVNYL